MLIQMVSLVLDVVAGLVAGTCLLRFLMQWQRISFQQPLGQFVFAVTDWLLLPLRRVIPPWSAWDLSSLLGAFLIKLVVASGGSADMLDGWTIGRLTRGDKVYSDPDGVKMISRLQVVRHLHLDEAAGKRKLDAEKEQCKLAKQEEKRAVSSLRLNDL